MKRVTSGVGYVALGLVFAVVPVFLVSGPESLSPSSVLGYVGGGLLALVGLAVLADTSALDDRPVGLIAAACAVVGFVGLVGQFVL